MRFSHHLRARPRKVAKQRERITLDAGGLIAIDRKNRRFIAPLARTQELGFRITIPVTALAQAIRSPARQMRLSRLIRQQGPDLVALHGPDATAVGLLLARTGTEDIVDAHVAICAQRAQQDKRSRRFAPDFARTRVGGCLMANRNSTGRRAITARKLCSNSP